MVEHAAVNRVVVGSSPTSGANLTEENDDSRLVEQLDFDGLCGARERFGQMTGRELAP